MWGREVDEDADRDTWAQLVWFITHNSITVRNQKLECLDEPKSIEPAALKILKRA